jgi:hypothetical protein
MEPWYSSSLKTEENPLHLPEPIHFSGLRQKVYLAD